MSFKRTNFELRRNQIIYPFGVGAIVDFPDDSLMTCSIDHWGDIAGKRIYDPRFQKWLGIDHFKMPPSDEESKLGVPFVRFPEWRFCPKCRKLKPIGEWKEKYEKNSSKEFIIPICYTCHIKLIPVRFIVVCKNGHIDDFPWEEWVHDGSRCSKKRDLRFITNPTISGLGGITIKCEDEKGSGCGESTSMAGSFNKKIHEKFGGCSGKKPWIRDNEGKSKKEVCNEIPRTAQKGASNVYFPNVKSSILIPPHSDDISIYDKLESSDLWELAIEEQEETHLKRIADKYEIEFDHLKILYEEKIDLAGSDGEDDNKNEVKYRYEEYKAFMGDIERGSLKTNNFEVELKDGSLYDIESIENLVLVKRLREIRSLISFSRLNPVERNEYAQEETSDSQVVFVSEDRNINWLPAIEVRGEGIFIKLDKEKIEKWENMNVIKDRVKEINRRILRRAEDRGIEARNLPAKFILLHTLAHLLIRQLNFECGYSSSALRERIYCNEDEHQPDMSGILIYTSSGDSEGSLGGLVKQGKPKFFNKIFKKAIQKAVWCSSDPLCIESEGQGMDSLNFAACHACSLVPETSCEEFNVFLDRVMLIGKPTESEIGFFNELI